MTVVAIWYEPGDNIAWAVSDTRVGVGGQNGGFVNRTDSASKIFELNIVTWRSSEREPYWTLNQIVSVGFAFAGDVLPALMTYASASMLLRHLRTLSSAPPPSIDEIGEFIRQLAERYSREALCGSNGTYGKFEAAVFGYCPRQRCHLAIRLVPILAETFEVEALHVGLNNEDEILALGSGKERLMEIWNELRKGGDQFSRRSRLPKIAVKRMVEEGRGDVGGALSVATCGRDGFKAYADVYPRRMGQPRAVMSWNGIDLFDDGHMMSIGDYQVIMNGMA